MVKWSLLQHFLITARAMKARPSPLFHPSEGDALSIETSHLQGATGIARTPVASTVLPLTTPRLSPPSVLVFRARVWNVYTHIHITMTCVCVFVRVRKTGDGRKKGEACGEHD